MAERTGDGMADRRGGTAEGADFGGYRLLEDLGDGDTDQVVRAHDREHGRDVALRVLAPHPDRRERFIREMPRVHRLTEPHLVPVHRYGEVGGRLFVAAELVEGEHLTAVLARTGPMDPARAVDVVGQLARALDAASAAGLVHRDVAAGSVLLAARPGTPTGSGSGTGEDTVLLADLGVAPLAGRAPACPAPELAAGTAVDGRADVYSLAGLLFELLTGERPGAGTDPPPPSSLRPGISPELDGVVARGLAADPDQRWTSAGGMAAAARAALALGGISVSRPADAPASGDTASGDTAADRRAGPGTPALAGAAAALLAALVAGTLRRRRRCRPGS
jgi:serine/threonine protein kinase